MKKRIRKWISRWWTDYAFSTFVSAAAYSVIDLLFILYNGFLGFFFHSDWNRTICLYFVFMAILRSILIYSRDVPSMKNRRKAKSQGRFMIRLTHAMMTFMNISLLVPISMMVRGEREIHLGWGTTLLLAFYTLYRIILSFGHYMRVLGVNDLLVRHLRTLNLVDALVAVMVLQNTMILANSGRMNASAKTGSILFASWIWLNIMILTIRSYLFSCDALEKEED